MTETLISLISIFIGIVGAISVGFLIKKHSFGIIGNTIAGVFGCIFIIKAFGRLGFDPQSIMQNGIFHKWLFMLNCILSFLGGMLGLILLKKIYLKMNKKGVN